MPLKAETLLPAIDALKAQVEQADTGQGRHVAE